MQTLNFVRHTYYRPNSEIIEGHDIPHEASTIWKLPSISCNKDTLLLECVELYNAIQQQDYEAEGFDEQFGYYWMRYYDHTIVRLRLVPSS